MFPVKGEWVGFDPWLAQRLKRLPPMQETQVQSLGREDPLEKEMAIHSSILAWKIPWTEKPSRLQSTGSQRVGHNWATSPHLTLSFANKTYDFPSSFFPFLFSLFLFSPMVFLFLFLSSFLFLLLLYFLCLLFLSISLSLKNKIVPEVSILVWKGYVKGRYWLNPLGWAWNWVGNYSAPI